MDGPLASTTCCYVVGVDGPLTCCNIVGVIDEGPSGPRVDRPVVCATFDNVVCVGVALSCATCCNVVGVIDVGVDSALVCATCCNVVDVIDEGPSGPRVDSPLACATCCNIVDVDGALVCATCCNVVGVIDEGPNGPVGQFAAQMARRAVLDRRCDEVSMCLSVCLSVLLPGCLSVGLSVSFSLSTLCLRKKNILPFIFVISLLSYGRNMCQGV